MHPFPHRYRVRIGAEAEGAMRLSAEDLPELVSLPPVEFDGPGDHWSPETLLLASVVDCFALTFRAIAKASRFEWRGLSADIEGLLERTGGNSRFTQLHTRARLVVPAGTDAAKARMLMEKAEKGCLISNSLTAERHLDCEIVEDR
jgi:organic hydroperoxide reductase OsmC/OhrA